jgi:TolB-like protein
LKLFLKNPERLVIFCLIILLPLQAMAADPARVAILPFTVHADKDYTFLQKGIVEMLTSRLSAPGKVEVIDPLSTEAAIAGIKGQSGDALALAVGQQLKAGYALAGSITVLGESISIDAKMLDVAGAKPPMAFFKQAQGMGGVIPQINQMATDIDQQVFHARSPAAAAPMAASPGVNPASATAGAAAGAAAGVAAGTAAGAAADVHMHPEKLLQSGQAAQPETLSPVNPLAAGATTQASQLNPAFVPAKGVTSASVEASFWKSQTYNELIVGVDVGDVDRDGQLETVVATPEKIYVYRFAQDRQQTVAEIKTNKFTRNISVDIGDINGNGTPEIFVTGFTSGLNALSSSVLEYDGKSFQTLVEKSSYFYRIMRRPQREAMLLGQKQVSAFTIFDDPIFEMKFVGGEYVPERKILPKGKANLLGLALGDLLNEGDEVMAILDVQDQLRVISPSGKTLWTSDEPFGGTPLYYCPPSKGEGNDAQKEYLPIRVRLVDLDGNGKVEVLAAVNHGKMSRTFAQQRFFKNSHIEGLGWNGIGLTPLWQTQQLSGRTQDFVTADFDNDGVEELLIALINKEGAIAFTDAKGVLIAFDLNASAPQRP